MRVHRPGRSVMEVLLVRGQNEARAGATQRPPVPQWRSCRGLRTGVDWASAWSQPHFSIALLLARTPGGGRPSSQAPRTSLAFPPSPASRPALRRRSPGAGQEPPRREGSPSPGSPLLKTAPLGTSSVFICGEIAESVKRDSLRSPRGRRGGCSLPGSHQLSPTTQAGAGRGLGWGRDRTRGSRRGRGARPAGPGTKTHAGERACGRAASSCMPMSRSSVAVTSAP